MASRNKQNNIHPTSTFTPVEGLQAARFETVLCVKCKQWRIYWVNQCNSDSHNILQIHHRLFTSMNKLLPRPLPLRSLPLLVAWGWVNFYLFTSGSHLCNCVYKSVNHSSLNNFLCSWIVITRDRILNRQSP